MLLPTGGNNIREARITMFSQIVSFLVTTTKVKRTIIKRTDEKKKYFKTKTKLKQVSPLTLTDGGPARCRGSA